MNILQVEKNYKALANKRRLAIVYYLYTTKKAPVHEIADYVGLSLKATSKHLQVLRSQKLVESRQLGLEQFYYLPDPENTFIQQVVSLL